MTENKTRGTREVIRGTREVIYRAVLAPGKVNGDWTVGDLRKFTDDCAWQGIQDDTKLIREDPYAFGEPSGCFIAERKFTV